MALTNLLFDQDDFDRLLSTRLSPFLTGGGVQQKTDGSAFHPRFDVVQKGDTVSILAELPGLSKEDVSIALANDRLTISGSTKKEKEYTDDAKVTHMERSFGSFTRSLQVPAGIKPEEVKARMENGVLKVELPAKPKQPEQAKITIS